MAITEIEVNTGSLSGDIGQLESTVSQLEREIRTMAGVVESLNATWDGPAKKMFESQFQKDRGICDEMCKLLREMIDSLKFARGEYDKSEQRVDAIVRSVRV